MRLLTACLIVSLTYVPWVWAAPKVGDKAKNLKVLPVWTMRTCPKEFFATYGLTEAKQLKLLDNDCALWKVSHEAFAKSRADFARIQIAYKQITQSYEKERALDQARLTELIQQLKKEIEEKNTYKYKPNHGWLYISVGAALAVTGLAFGVGVWVAKK